MSWIRRFGGRLPDFDAVVRRFPIPLAIMAAFTVWIIANNHSDVWSYRDADYIASGFVLAGYVAVIIKLIVERRKASRLISVIVGLGAALSAFILCYFARKLDFTVAMAIGGAIIFLGNAAAWRSGRQDRNVWNFTQKLWTGALFAAVGSVIFALGMVAISEAVKALFGVDVDEFTYETILPIGLAFLAPLYWLGTLPKYGEAGDVTELSFEARALSFLGTWMLAPLVIIYALIVLAYGAKVLMQWNLPKGEIAQLVSPFIGVGILVWLMLEPKVLKESGFVRFYRAAWHWIMLPAAVLLGVAVFIRIREYGFTPERFFLALVVIWAVAQSLWFNVMPQAKRDIRIPTALAAGLLIFGAFAASPLSLQNQFQRGLTAKAQLGDFDELAIRLSPEAVTNFKASLKYLVKIKDEKRFIRLLPDYKMPKYAYGDDWEKLISKLNLEDADDEVVTLRTSYILQAETPIQISENSVFYGSYKLRLAKGYRERQRTDDVTLLDGFTATFNLEGEKFVVEFGDVFDSLHLPSRDDLRGPIRVPAETIVSSSGEEITMLILSGYMSETGDGGRRDGDVEVAFIVPN